MDISAIHFHDTQILRVIEDCVTSTLTMEVEYPVDWERNVVEKRLLVFDDVHSYQGFRAAVPRFTDDPRSTGCCRRRSMEQASPGHERGSQRVELHCSQTLCGLTLCCSKRRQGACAFFPMRVKSRRERFKIPADKMAVAPYMGSDTNSPAYKAGLRGGGHVIIAVNGESPNLIAREFLAWFTHKFDPGDYVKLSVLDQNGEQREVTYQLPPQR